MPSNSITIQITAESVAWYAAIVATVGIVISLYNAWRDRARIKINYNPHMYINNGESLNYPTGVKHLSIDVINIGRRPIRIEMVYLLIAGDNKKTLLTDSFAEHRPKVITEEKPRTTFLVKEDLVDLSKVYCVIVVDGTGRKHKKYISIFPSFILLLAFIKKKKKI